MTSDEEDIATSLRILFGTAAGERFLTPGYGLDLQELLFAPLTTTMTSFLKDRIKTAILIYEPRINLIALNVDTSRHTEGKLQILVEYEVRATNSRFNLVYPFYLPSAGQSEAGNAATRSPS